MEKLVDQKVEAMMMYDQVAEWRRRELVSSSVRSGMERRNTGGRRFNLRTVVRMTKKVIDNEDWRRASEIGWYGSVHVTTREEIRT